MRETGYPPGVIERFEKMPFDLWRGANVFNDDFDLLYGKVNLDSTSNSKRKRGSRMEVALLRILQM